LRRYKTRQGGNPVGKRGRMDAEDKGRESRYSS
ncbi:MAG: hypothetical protein JWR35_3886, partial [Marmoricola sp.]|nr:hypothetical protein [Marmoricola sp.]